MFANVNGKKIFFDVVGEGLSTATPELKPRPTFVVLHCASGFDHGYLRNSLHQLSLFGQIVYIDLPGSGRSKHVDVKTITFESMADDVKGMIDYLGIQSPYIFAHCAGGFVAQHFAIRHPGVAKGLILVNTAPSYTKSHDQVAPNPMLNERATEDIVNTCLRVYAPGVVSEETLTQELVDKMLKEVGPYFFAEDYMDMYDSVFSFTGMNVEMLDHFVTEIYPKFDVREEIKQIDIPTLIVAGSQDWLTPPSGARLMHKNIKNSIYREFAESCHLSFAEKPQSFIGCVEGFLDLQKA
ncbi:alpha/beta hydrolase [Pantoea sp. Al-1710]|uniref:Alpha/beta hydrolase n=1 Tax=Candidatus Pantoea communis TaxID=2608354 RepID=A0ABX0RJI9_9GAMM|nr:MULTISPECIES: alpha/beta hydrolase [Pantoea]NIG13030.1 alpha/beta hydrolase [Pantoea sp. Cy-640]NIG17269.1 alpha/beta hydrolase [Pantoea communis]